MHSISSVLNGTATDMFHRAPFPLLFSLQENGEKGIVSDFSCILREETRAFNRK